MPLSMQLGMPLTIKMVMPNNYIFLHCVQESFARGGGITPKGIYKQRLQFMCTKIAGRGNAEQLQIYLHGWPTCL
jgi:hypothetical protein